MIKFSELFLALIIFFPKAYSHSDSVRISNAASLSDSTKAEQYLLEGMNYFNAHRFDSSIACFENAKQIFDDCRLWNKSIVTRIKIGNSLRAKAELDSALRSAENALIISKNKTNIDDSLRASIYNLFGFIFNGKGEYDKALSYAQKAENFINDRSIPKAENLSLKGLIYSNVNELDSSLVNLSKAIEIEKRILGKDHPSIGTEYNTMASLYEQKGNYEKGLDYYFKSFKLKIKSLGEKHTDVSILYNNIAANYFHQGEYDLALEYYFKSLSIDKKLLEENHPNFGYRYNNIAMVYRVKGMYDKALEYGIKSKNIFYKAYGNDHPNYAGVVNNIGKTYYDIGDFDKAIEFYKNSLEIFKNILGGSHPLIAKLLQNIGDVYREKSEYEKSLNYFSNALRIRINALGEKHPGTAESFKKIGDVFFARNEFDSALTNYQNAIISFVQNFNDKSPRTNPELKDLPPKQLLLTTLHQKARVFSKKYNFSDEKDDIAISLNSYLLCTGLISKIRDSYSTESAKLFIDRENYGIFIGGIKAALELFELTGRNQYKEIAFNFAEANKASVLLGSLNELKAKRFSRIPDSLLEKEKELQIELSYCDIQIEKEKSKKNRIDSAKLMDLQDSFFALHRKYEKLQKIFEKNYPKYFHLKHNPESYSPEEIQERILNKDNSIIEYAVGDSVLFIFLISKNKITIRSVKTNQPLNDLVKKFRNSLSNLSFKNYLSSAHELYNVLIKPVSKELSGISEIYVIPDAILNYLPFGALIKDLPEAQGLDFSNLNYLIKDFSISYYFSASLLNDSFDDLSTSNEKFIGIAPVFSIEDKPEIASLRDSKPDPGSKQKIKFDEKSYSFLPESEIELRKIKNLFDGKNLTAKIFTRSQAREEIMKSDEIFGYDFIHIASHGFFNDEIPELSGILFSTDSSNEDGVLYSSEIYNLNLNADLAVLSSCESGLGKIVKGEGIIGLARGFVYSGVKNLVVSLWQVSDISTSELMVEFYKNVLDGKNYSSSLRLAKLELIKENKFSYPLEWSSFILLGK